MHVDIMTKLKVDKQKNPLINETLISVFQTSVSSTDASMALKITKLSFAIPLTHLLLMPFVSFSLFFCQFVQLEAKKQKIL